MSYACIRQGEHQGEDQGDQRNNICRGERVGEYVTRDSFGAPKVYHFKLLVCVVASVNLLQSHIAIAIAHA